jgi:alkylation response protein AidB-like acyl-CoA dehydrogenase
MATPGIRVEPLVFLTGEHVQNRVHFSNVRVPRANVIGKVGAGWAVAKFLLQHERGGGFYSPELSRRLDDIWDFARTTMISPWSRLADDPLFSTKLSAARIRVSALEIYELRALSRRTGQGPNADSASIVKIFGTELQQHVTELAMEAAGHYGRAYQPQAAHPAGPVDFPYSRSTPVGPLPAAIAPLRYFNERAGSIYAGSNEIQRNILAKSVLGS